MPKYKYYRKTATYNGRRYEGVGKTEMDAMLALAEKLSAAKRGEDVVSGSMTVDAWFKQWLTVYKKPKGLTEKSLGMYTEKYNGYIKPAIGHLRLQDVRDIQLQGILNQEAGKSASHVQKLRMVMQQLFRRARQSRLIPYDPAELLELPSGVRRSRRSITDEERRAILAVAQTHRSGLWIQTLLYTGMRPGETAALTWADVDLAANEIHIRTARESGKTERLKDPKTAAGVRDIPIHAQLRPLLLAARGEAQDDDPVFPTGSGGRQNENSLRRLWTGFLRDLDIYLGAELQRNKIVTSKVAPDLCPYCLRHTFCTDLQRAGVPLNVAKELMGHADISTTANIYTHKDSGTLHASMALLDGTGKKDDEAPLTDSDARDSMGI